MEYQEIALGEATYEILRVYSDERSAAELLLERLTQTHQPDPSFDGTRADSL